MYFWWVGHIKTPVMPMPFSSFGYKYPQTKAESLHCELTEDIKCLHTPAKMAGFWNEQQKPYINYVILTSVPCGRQLK